MLNFELKPLEELKTIDFNYKRLKEEIEQTIKKYDGLVYDDTQVIEAKKDRAHLNKLRKVLNEKKIEVKKVIMKPYAEFEHKLDALGTLLKHPIESIDQQVKQYEIKKKEEKRDKIKELFIEIFNQIFTGQDKQVISLSFDKVKVKDRWLNATYSIKKIKEEIKEKIEGIKNDILSLRELEFYQESKQRYLENFSLSEALKRNSELQALKKTLEHLKQEKEEARQQQQEQEAARRKQQQQKQEDAEQQREQERVKIEQQQDEKERQWQQWQRQQQKQEEMVLQSINVQEEDREKDQEMAKKKLYKMEILLNKEEAYKLKKFFTDNDIEYRLVR